MLTLPLTLLAQPPMHAKQEKMNPEQLAILQAKKMRLQLDLTDAQEEKVKASLEGQMEAIKAHREKVKSEKLSEYDRKLHFLEMQAAMQEQLKSILDTDQYEKWQKSRGKNRRMAFEQSRNRMGKNGAMKKERPPRRRE